MEESILLRVHRPSGDTLTLHVHPNASIGDLKREIQVLLGIEMERQRLLVDANELCDELKILQLGENPLITLLVCSALWSAIGPKPSHSWENEWAEMCVEDALLSFGDDRARLEDFDAWSIVERKQDFKHYIEWCTSNGWPKEKAEVYTIVGICCITSIARALRDRSSEYAASTYLLCEVLAEQAQRLQEPAPRAYRHLGGHLYGLIAIDPAWDALFSAELPGFTFTTSAISTGNTDPACFENERGFHSPTPSRRGVRFAFQDSDIVCFVSKPAIGSVVRSLIQVAESCYVVPPMSTITLEETLQSGEWEAFGRIIKQRCFVVGVSYTVPKELVNE